MDELELMQAQAAAGDVEAMLGLVRLHTMDHEFDEALAWAEKAAETGDPEGRFQAIILRTANLGDAVRDKDGEAMREHARIICYHSIQLITAHHEGETELSRDDLGRLAAHFAEARYYFAASTVFIEDCDAREALAHVADATDVRGRLLRQVLLYELDDDAWSAGEMMDCLCDRQYMHAEKNGVEQCVIASAAAYVSAELSLNRHVKEGMGVIDGAMAMLQDEDALRLLREERALYRKGLFGWKYTGK